jgi:hypothetical protein
MTRIREAAEKRRLTEYGGGEGQDKVDQHIDDFVHVVVLLFGREVLDKATFAPTSVK